MAITMSQPTSSGSAITSGPIAGFGYQAIVALAWDNSYADGGEVVDFSSIFPNDVYGGVNIADTSSDGGHVMRFVLGASLSAAATNISSSKFQLYGEGGGASGAALTERTSATDVSAVDAQRWIMFGR